MGQNIASVFRYDLQMACPHCRVTIHVQFSTTMLGKDSDGGWRFDSAICPACDRFIISLYNGDYLADTRGAKLLNSRGRLVHPRVANRPPCPPQVSVPLADDYREACLVLLDSPKASAALSRRCLQGLLREKGCVAPGDLAREIDQVLAAGTLPSYLSEAIDPIRNIGNFAAHPLKSTATGEILPVEPGEAEWTLDVLELLFDFYYVQPDLTAKKKAALNAKLQQAGKPPAK